MGYDKVKLFWGAVPYQQEFKFDDPDFNEDYTLESISGLEPPPIDVIIGDKVSEGGIFQGRRAQNKEIVILLGFKPTYQSGTASLQDLRRKLYTLLSPPNNNIPAVYIYDSTGALPTAFIQGYIKSMEANPFSKDPQIQITISCVTPYFLLPQYTHPNPASLNGINPIVVNNNGDVFAGFDITLKLTANATMLRLYGNGNHKHIRIDYAFLTNDFVRIVTTPGARSVTRTRGGIALNLLHNLNIASSWYGLDPGSNNLTVYGSVGAITTFEVTAFSFLPRMWGI